MSDSSFNQNSEEDKAYKRKKSKVESEIESQSSEEDRQKGDSLFKPQVETLVNDEQAEDGQKFLCKMKNISYLHLRWFTEEEICAMPYGKMKITRYKKDQQKRLATEESQSEEENDLQKRHNFDLSCLEVDRILFTTEVFQVVHPRQAQQIQGRWQEKCIMAMSKIMNFYKNYISFASPFLEPVDPLLDGAPDYPKIIKYPMDFVQIHNRLHNGFYKQVQSFWKDLGYVYKNCLKFNTDNDDDVRIMNDTLRQITIHLYRQWHRIVESELKQSYQQNQQFMKFNFAWIVNNIPGFDTGSAEFSEENIELMNFDWEELLKNDNQLYKEYLTQEELEKIDLASETDRLFLVKWKNLSYTESTWELESVLNAPQKIGDFFRFNRALDSHTRKNVAELTTNYQKILNHQASLKLAQGKRNKYNQLTPQLYSALQKTLDN